MVKTEEIDEAAPAAAELEMTKDHMNYDLVDKEVAQYANEVIVEIDEETNKRLKRKIDKRVMLVMIVTYLIQTLDKGTLSYASIMGIQKDLNLHGQQYSWLTTIVYLIILTVEYPENWIIQRVPLGKWISINIILWGVALSLQTAMKNFEGIIALRAFLGVFEAATQPTFTLLSGMWYTRKEQAGAVTFWFMMNGVNTIVGSFLAFCFSHVPKTAPIKSWQALFLTYGIFTVFWGIFVGWYLPDSPMKAHCFSEEDKKLMVERVRKNRTGLQNRKFRKDQLWDAFTDPQVYAIALIQLFLTIPSGGLGAFNNIIVSSFGFTTWQVQLLQMVNGVVQVISMLGAVWVDHRFKQTILAMMASIIPTIAGVIVLLTVPFEYHKRIGLLFSYYIITAYWGAAGLALSLVTRNIAGQTKKSIVIAVNFIFWAVGNAIGPQTYRSNQAPRYFVAISITLGCFVLLEITLFSLRSYYIYQNKKRDKKIESGEVVADTNYTHSFEDITDRPPVMSETTQLPPNRPESPEIHRKIKLLINNLINIKDETGKYLLHVPNGRVIDTKSWQGWDWTHGIGLYGIWKYYELTGDESLLRIIEDWFAARFAEGGTTKNINTMAALLALANVYEKTGNATYLPWLDSWAEWAMYDLPRTRYGGMQHVTYELENYQQLWDDTLMMTVLPLAKIGKILKRPHYIAEAKRQFLIHIKYLFDRQSGLWFHGWTFEDGGHNFASALWARGNSWVTIVIPEIIELLDLPPGDVLGEHLIDTLRAQCETLQRLQDVSGFWHTLLNHADSYMESSATVGFAFGILKAVRKRYIEPKYKGVAEKALSAAITVIDEKGELLNTSFGTPLGSTLDDYKRIPLTAMPYGQAMAIMALAEYLWTYI
ncbi:hypothetical protein TCE0_044r16075 [Talaromyces pinophilus]|uniref:Major facilitator superfamily (MFS) profile domain-containing protein n=1 Tax=Talaromyces pinophilus TaxID=128442 RepID=A0A478EBN0_TALPI|nr:hypothetical protein TCE0_044r16075 [Talaromyces pinophilus]